MTTTDDESGAFHIDFANGKKINLDEVRAQKSAFMPDNSHAWVIYTVYGLDDPEQSLDLMELGAENFVGVSPIHCLVCQVEYDSSIRFNKCSQVVVKR